jgi:hypothetical protein
MKEYRLSKTYIKNEAKAQIFQFKKGHIIGVIVISLVFAFLKYQTIEMVALATLFFSALLLIIEFVRRLISIPLFTHSNKTLKFLVTEDKIEQHFLKMYPAAIKLNEAFECNEEDKGLLLTQKQKKIFVSIHLENYDELKAFLLSKVKNYTTEP